MRGIQHNRDSEASVSFTSRQTAPSPNSSRRHVSTPLNINRFSNARNFGDFVTHTLRAYRPGPIAPGPAASMSGINSNHHFIASARRRACRRLRNGIASCRAGQAIIVAFKRIAGSVPSVGANLFATYRRWRRRNIGNHGKNDRIAAALPLTAPVLPFSSQIDKQPQRFAHLRCSGTDHFYPDCYRQPKQQP